jgi:EAL domain-containing protein (putative c-di-GMP-specific phosphodiesterase class I)
MPISEIPNRIPLEELKGYFQPIANLKTGLITGLETCLCQATQGSSMQFAAEILALAGDTGQESEINRHMLEAAARELSALEVSMVNPIPITVNFTYATMTDPVALDTLDHILNRVALPRAMFRLEIPENAVFKQPSAVFERMRVWRQAGYTLGIDRVTSDSVYAAASNLGAIVKFSESLLEGVPNDPERSKRLRNLLQKAEMKKLQTGIEGLHRHDQLTFLQQTNCNEGQGLLLSKPRPLSELLFLLKRGRCW